MGEEREKVKAREGSPSHAQRISKVPKPDAGFDDTPQTALLGMKGRPSLFALLAGKSNEVQRHRIQAALAFTQGSYTIARFK